ncbi:MAG: hypothetical protein GY757_37990 [bacterium]|nr:hypothetical protein [bacterium]
MERILQILEDPQLGLEVVAENIRLDFPTLSSSHELAATHGNNVQPPLEAKFKEKAANRNLEPNDPVKGLTYVSYYLSGRKKPHYQCTYNKPNLCQRNETNLQTYYKHSFTRYISVRRYFDSFIRSLTNNENPGIPGIKRYVDKNLRELRDNPPSEFPEGFMAAPPELIRKRGKYPSPAWITPTRNAPHTREQFAELENQHEKAWYVVKEMALPGYEDDVERKNKIGIIALEFEITDSIDIFKPTILDALDSAYFFPGPGTEVYGETMALDNQLQPTSKKGAREFICEPFIIPVKKDDKILVKKIGYFEESN